jgi:16S rRNA (adenine1518-N6/adenine1519-N6)-dimethyltransferase
VALSPSDVRRLLADAGLEPRRSLGQNFVVDANTVARIARLAEVGPGDDVVEIGPGLGSLTLALLDTGAAITCIETDGNLIPILEGVTEGRARVIHGDAREVDWATVIPGTGWTLVANLPYNLGTSLVIDVLDHVPAVQRLLVMVQREAGERMVAGVGDGAYGAVSVRIAMRASGAIVAMVPPTVFYPRPKVTSCLVSLKRHEEPAIPPDLDESLVIGLVRAGFAQRRKMLRRSLKAMTDVETITRAGIRPEARAEELDLEAWVELARAVHGLDSGEEVSS